MTTTVDNGSEALTNGFVQVAVLGGDIHTVDCVEGLTIQQALTHAEVTLEHGQVVTLNGAPTQDLNQAIEPNSVLGVVSRVKNG